MSDTREGQANAAGLVLPCAGQVWMPEAAPPKQPVAQYQQPPQRPDTLGVQAVAPNGQGATLGGTGTVAHAGPHAPAQASLPPVASTIPSTLYAMQQSRRWLLWRAVPDSDPSKKPRKVPYYANGTPRGVTDTPEDWAQLATYQQALAVAHWYSGLGFALGDGWQGIDFDDVSINQLSRFANEVGGYVEFSPSETGCHAIGYGRSFQNLASNKTGIEAYCCRRFFTFTGSLIRDAPLTCLAEYVVQVLAPHHAKGRAQPKLSTGCPAWNPHITLDDIPNGPEVRPDAEVWEAISCATNFETIRELACRPGSLAKNQHDAGLMQHLVFYSPNNEQVLRMFKVTPLAQRDKVQRRREYILNTLNLARYYWLTELEAEKARAAERNAGPMGQAALQVMQAQAEKESKLKAMREYIAQHSKDLKP